MLAHESQAFEGALRIAAAQPDDPRHEARESAGARERVVVDGETEKAVGAGGVERARLLEGALHALGLTGGAPVAAAQLGLAGPVAEGGAEPEIRLGAARIGRSGMDRFLRPRDGIGEEGVDGVGLEGLLAARLTPPDEGRGLQRGADGIVRTFQRQAGEVELRGAEAPAVDELLSGEDLGGARRIRGARRMGILGPRRLGRREGAERDADQPVTMGRRTDLAATSRSTRSASNANARPAGDSGSASTTGTPESHSSCTRA